MLGKQETVLADVLTSDAWKILDYARFSGLVILPLPPLISSIAMKEQISNKGVLAASFHNNFPDSKGTLHLCD